MTKTKTHGNNFDTIRLILALSVMIFHSGILFNLPEIARFSIGSAVQCFFIISGYLIFQSWERSPSLKEYAVKRAKRLLPGLWFCVFLTVLLGVFLTNLPIIEYFGLDLVKYSIANLSTLNFISPRLPNVFINNPESGFVNGSLWTLKVEIFFYISVPVLFCIFKKRIRFGVVFGFIIAMLYKLFCLTYGDVLEVKFGQGLYKAIFDPHTSPFANMTFFLAGALFYYARNLLSKYYNSAAYLIIAVICCIMMRFDLLNSAIYPIALGFAVIYFAVYLPVKVKIPHKIGDLSYGVYIYHFPIYQTLIQLNLVDKIGYCKTIFIGYSLTLICAYLSWHFIESRFLKKR